MAETIIKVENLGKKYIINHQQERYLALRDVITRKAKSLLRQPEQKLKKEDFWALKDVSFDIKQGEKVGVIGRNGAGKSTLLKLLSRITDPSSGSIMLKGRVASLLEVGTGFHPELTGRENIYLNGAILGMSKQEIKKKFEEIVAFAEVEQFLDTPVKRYSSGMYVRLAFSVAAHLEPEILIVDEVLAVGDAQFQKKCIGKMGEIGDQGRTLLVVSHQMSMIQQLTDQCILLEKGRIEAFTETKKAISSYLATGEGTVSQSFTEDDVVYSIGSPYFRVTRIELRDKDLKDLPQILDTSFNEIHFVVEGFIDKPDRLLCIGFGLFDEMNNLLILSYQTDQPEEEWPKLQKGPFSLKAKIDISMLNEGRYRLEFLSTIHCERMVHNSMNTASLQFEVVGNRSESPYWVRKRDSLLAPVIHWEG